MERGSSTNSQQVHGPRELPVRESRRSTGQLRDRRDRRMGISRRPYPRTSIRTSPTIRASSATLASRPDGSVQSPTASVPSRRTGPSILLPPSGYPSGEPPQQASLSEPPDSLSGSSHPDLNLDKPVPGSFIHDRNQPCTMTARACNSPLASDVMT